MYYAIYKNVRNSAWQCLLDFKIDTLPIDIVKIARKANIRIVKNSIVDDLDPDEHGKAYYDGSNWTIIYNDLDPVPVCRMTIAHELGHIFLGHEMTHQKYAEVYEFNKQPKSEQQADAFAARLLCPACVIWDMNLNTENDIANYCRVDINTAKKRFQRMKTLYKRNKFLTDPLEYELYMRFKNKTH